jgi:hypothetical protein
MANTWPPVLADFKNDMDVPSDDTRNDTQYAIDLASAIAFVEAVCADQWNFDLTKPWLPAPVDALAWQGTLRLAARYAYRRRSPDGMVNMGDAGGVKIPTTDLDIDRMLRIGAYSPPTFA